MKTAKIFAFLNKEIEKGWIEEIISIGGIESPHFDTNVDCITDLP